MNKHNSLNCTYHSFGAQKLQLEKVSSFNFKLMMLIDEPVPQFSSTD